MNATTSTKPTSARSKSGKYAILLTKPRFPGAMWRIGAFKIGEDGVVPSRSETAHSELAARATANAMWRAL